jgi:hypothetical protein
MLHIIVTTTFISENLKRRNRFGGFNKEGEVIGLFRRGVQKFQGTDRVPDYSGAYIFCLFTAVFPLHTQKCVSFHMLRKVLRTTLRSQTELESTHYQEKETNRCKSKRNQLTNWEKIQPDYRKQTTNL